MRADTGGISCCFDSLTRRMLDDYKRRGLGSTSGTILDEVSSQGISGRTVLELGCGVGGLAVELIRKGASSAVGLDLSPNMVAAARALAAESGVSSSAEFRQGDGATADLPTSDVVVLDAVVCCYPDAESLVAHSSSAARNLYAVSVPDDRLLLTKALRVLLPLQKMFLRRGGFRFFVHPVGSMIRLLEGKGFRLVADVRVGYVWGVLVFAARGT